VVKKENLTNLWNTLQLFYTSEHFYPMPQEKTATNLWWYNKNINATVSNKIKVTYDDQEIKTIVSAETLWWWKIMWINGNLSNQIWAKWVIGRIWTFNKKYLKKDVYDTQLWDTKIIDIDSSTAWNQKWKMIDFWIWKYTYAVYARATTPANWNISWSKWTFYELATTFKDLEWEWYVTHIDWPYSNDEFSNPDDYPETLIWLKEWEKDENVATTEDDQWIPYPIDWFAK
jgi:hypothetical protein